jgi:protein deglycase
MKQALLPLMEGFEEMEAITIIDILRRGQINVTVAGLESAIIEGAHGITLIVDGLLEHFLGQEFDLVVLAGGAGTFRLSEDERVLNLIKQQANSGKLVGAICAAPLVLLAAEILTHKKMTSHPQVKVKFSQVDNIEYLETAIVVDGNIITSRGIGTAIPFALKILELLHGDRAIAQQVSKDILYEQG